MSDGDELWTRRMYLTTKAMLAGASIYEAHEAAATVALANPEWDMSERRSWVEWEHDGEGADDEDGPLLTPGQVARLFAVDRKTVARWANSGRLTAIRTPGGHRRYRASEVERYFHDG